MRDVDVRPSMLTMTKVETYRTYRGDIDGWSRRPKHTPDDITDEEWMSLMQLIQRLAICRDGLAAAEYAIETERLLKEIAPDPQVQSAIRAIIPKS